MRLFPLNGLDVLSNDLLSEKKPVISYIISVLYDVGDCKKDDKQLNYLVGKNVISDDWRTN